MVPPSQHTISFIWTALISIPFGVAVGGVLGLVNQVWRSRNKAGYEEVKTLNHSDENDALWATEIDLMN